MDDTTTDASPVEAAAEHVLVAAGVHIESIHSTDDYFSYLERAAGTHLPPLKPITCGGADADGNGVLTCTNPSPAAAAASAAATPRPASDVWNPLDAVGVSASMTTAMDTTMTEEYDDDVFCLEDAVPFTPDFYRSFGEFLCTCLNGETVGDGNDDFTSPAAVVTARYSLPRDNDAVRATRLLCALMEYNVGDGESDVMVDGFKGSGTFLSLLLRHCEGNTSDQTITGTACTNGSGTGDGNTDDVDENGPKQGTCPMKVRRIPIIGALYRHLSSLPVLEAYVRSWARRRRYPQHSSTLAVDPTVTLATPTTTTQLSSDAASDRLRALKLWENEKERLEGELSNHIAMLEYVLGSIYRECDAELRGRCRTKLGGILHVFSLSSGGGPTPMMRLGVSSSGAGGSAAAIGALGGSGAMGVEDASAAGINAALKVLLRIVEGIDRSSPLAPAHESLLLDVLLPLHKPSGMVLWRDQTPVLGLYHETLVRCVGAMLVRNKALIAKVIRSLLHPDIWPTEGGVQGRNRGGASGGGGVGVVANTPKVVLLLHEVDTYLGLLNIASIDKGGESVDSTYCNASNNIERDALISTFSDTFLPLTARLASCIESDNSRTSERALQYFRNKQFAVLVGHYRKMIMPVLLRALCRVDAGMQVPWNPTVRKMTLLVLKELEAIDEELFMKSCEDAFGGRNRERGTKAEEKVEVTASRSGSASLSVGASPLGNVTQDMTSLRGGMGTWRPPSGAGGSIGRGTRASRGVGVGSQPPLTVTGVAPWAAGSGAGGTPKQPPLTVTGVAPWAVGGSTAGPNGKKTTTSPRGSTGQRLPTKTQQPGRGMAPWSSQKSLKTPRSCMGPPLNKRKAAAQYSMDGKSPAREETYTETVDDAPMSTASLTGIMRVRRFKEELKPPKVEGEENNDGVSSWAKAQMAESPTLLPSLKFHDLVFGQTLGEGSFGSVRYGRQIVKDRTRSYWPEFAVKIVSTEKISSLGYEQSINREIAILRTMSHPGIARLISTFRFRDGAYLVLEYASGGDLHSLLKRNGSIDHASTQFVIGEIVAALCSIHDAGFVFGDLKPENCLITESGHVKLTDFGGCRPYTFQAKELVKLSSRNLIEMLRDGDWRDSSEGGYKQKKSDAESSDDLNGANFLDDDAAEEDEGERHVEDLDADGSVEEDFRVEGTTAYLPPEVVVGGIPTTSADSWALGCVLYQCISGRPPILEDTDNLTRHRIVTFELSSQTHEEDFFGIHDESTFQPVAKELIRKLLSRNPYGRPNMQSIAHDDFFEGKDVFSLHKEQAYPLDVGTVAPVTDAKWNRRQFSSIWAPQPKQYAIDNLGTSNATGGSSAWDKERNSPIREGAERDAHFLSTRRPTALMQIGE